MTANPSLSDVLAALQLSPGRPGCQPTYNIDPGTLSLCAQYLANNAERLQDMETAVAQAAEFAEYVEQHAKGKMEEAAKRFLSLPYSQELATRLRDAERYRWLRLAALEVAWNQQVSYSPGYSESGPEELDAAIDAARAGGGG